MYTNMCWLKFNSDIKLVNDFYLLDILKPVSEIII